MRFSLFTALALAATGAVSAVPMLESPVELSARQVNCNIAACATGLLTTIPGLIAGASLSALLLTSCLTTLVASPTTAVPICLATVLSLGAAAPVGCALSCLDV